LTLTENTVRKGVEGTSLANLETHVGGVALALVLLLGPDTGSGRVVEETRLEEERGDRVDEAHPAFVSFLPEHFSWIGEGDKRNIAR
jgi:hypothetical protein